LAGAVLRIIDDKGTTVEEWTSDGSAHTIKDQLIDGESYRLLEVETPSGYRFAKDIQFTATQNLKVVMADEEIPKDQPQNGSVSVTKQLTSYGNVLGAKDQTFYVALYEDAECTYRITEIKSLEFKMASEVTVTFDGLEPGKTYYLGEADVNGINLISGQVKDGTLFQTDFIQGQAVTAGTTAGASTIKFLNEFYEIPHEFYIEGNLTITKKLVDADGNASETSETFYAGIFADPEFTTLSDMVSSNIVALQLNDTSEVSETVKVAMSDDGKTNLYVTEVDADGTPVSQNTDFAYEVTIDGSSVSMDEKNTTAAVTITNQMPEQTPREDDSPNEPETDESETITDETQSETEKLTEKATEKETEKTTEKTSTSVATGDTTPIVQYVILLLLAIVIVSLLVIRMRRRHRQ
jgi:hypothetical protein